MTLGEKIANVNVVSNSNDILMQQNRGRQRQHQQGRRGSHAPSRGRGRQMTGPPPGNQQWQPGTVGPQCSKCGSTQCYGGNQCRAIGKFCRRCNMPDHFESVCRSHGFINGQQNAMPYAPYEYNPNYGHNLS